VDLLNFVFRLGVLFAIYGFIWGLIELAVMILSAGRSRSLGEIYTIRALKYIFLADVTFLFCLSDLDSSMVMVNEIIFAGIILLTYFIGKLQNNQVRTKMFNITAPGMSQGKDKFNMKIELGVIALSIIAFSLFWFFPQYASNPISNWFHESIINIEDTPIFGFVFKVIGFFFLITLFAKMVSAFNFLLSGQAFKKGVSNSYKEERNDDHFDDFTEIK
jgi:hypothetical protein